jgi:hypothetical protein
MHNWILTGKCLATHPRRYLAEVTMQLLEIAEFAVDGAEVIRYLLENLD